MTDLVDLNAPIQKLHPFAMRRCLGATYNCLGLTFASRRAEIDDAFLAQILREDGYRLILQDELQVGDIAVYWRANLALRHVGIVYSIPLVTDSLGVIKILSKWGEAGEYLHNVDDVPAAYGSVQQYYTERTN